MLLTFIVGLFVGLGLGGVIVDALNVDVINPMGDDE